MVDSLEYVQIASVSDLPNGERLFVTVDDKSIVVFNIAGVFFAIEDECSHDGNSLEGAELDGHEVICPRHGARFDVRSGKALSMPAVVDISTYPVRVVNGNIELGLLFDT